MYLFGVSFESFFLRVCVCQQDHYVKRRYISEGQRIVDEQRPVVTPSDVVDAVCRGFDTGMADTGVMVRSILCCMTHRPGRQHQLFIYCNTTFLRLCRLQCSHFISHTTTQNDLSPTMQHNSVQYTCTRIPVQ